MKIFAPQKKFDFEKILIEKFDFENFLIEIKGSANIKLL